MTFRHQNDLVGRFAQHRVAANLLMLMMVLAGFWALTQLNTQFFPNFAFDVVNVRVVWSGASSEDVERAITSPMEQELRSVDGLRKMNSTSSDGLAVISLEFEEGTDMTEAQNQVTERVGLVRNLPETAEKPEINRQVRYEPVAHLLVTGPALNGLRPLVHRFERELLEAGIAKIDITGLPEEEIAIQVPSRRLAELGTTLGELGDRVAAASRDIPAGTVGREEAGRQLRSLDQRRSVLAFEDLPLIADRSGRLLRLGEVADVERRARDGEVEVFYRGAPAVELTLQRTESADSLKSARVLEQWLAKTRPQLPAGVELHPFDQSWQLIEERTNLLLKNGASGLVLVVLILFLFLNGRVAWWVTMGIPVSFLATLAILWAVGGSINMISLFALIMALGIIVDDAIVVGEDSLTHYQTGENSLEAAEGGARRMLAPVLSSSLTTIAAFLPLMMVGGIIGNILGDIPLVIICVILASLVESFLILPGHLRQSFLHLHHREPGRLRQRLDAAFDRFRDHTFRPLVERAVSHRAITVSLAFAALVLAVGLLAGGRLSFTFFPSPESTVLQANVAFAAGTPRATVRDFLQQLERTLEQTETDLGGGLVMAAVARAGMASADGGRSTQRGDHFGSLQVELVSPDAREVRNRAFIAHWRGLIREPAGLENFTISERVGGPPGKDLDIRLTGADPLALKAAAIDLRAQLATFPGVSAVEDDMPFGPEQLVFRLTPEALAAGLTVAQVGDQLRTAYDGRLVQIYQDGRDEVEVRVLLPDAERDRIGSLDRLQLRTPDGALMPLRSAVTFDYRRGLEVLRHAEGRLAGEITGDVDREVNNSNRILATLGEGFLPELASRYGIDYSFEGRAADQAETLGDMKRGLLFALALIYLVLSWVFASYGWPLVVMTAIPFGLVGAIAGHWLLGIDLTVLSLFGLFGLSGIVVNDSIILVTFFKELRERDVPVQEAIVQAACLRLRAVLLTTLTTIAGLVPLLFEGSLQAQFLIPMAVSISFGLGFATVLVLLVIPTLLSLHESAAGRISRLLRSLRGTPEGAA